MSCEWRGCIEPFDYITTWNGDCVRSCRLEWEGLVVGLITCMKSS